MNISVPAELIEQAIDELEKSKLMMSGGLITLQSMPIPAKTKRELIINSHKIGVIAGKMFAYTLKAELVSDEIKEVERIEELSLARSLLRFDKKHKET